MDTVDDDVLFSRGPLSAFQVIKLMTKNNWVNKQKVIFSPAASADDDDEEGEREIISGLCSIIIFFSNDSLIFYA